MPDMHDDMPTDGPSRLELWLVRSRYTQVEAARLIGITPSQFNQLVQGTRRPGLTTAHAVEDITGIPTRAWESITDDPTAEGDGKPPAKRRLTSRKAA